MMKKRIRLLSMKKTVMLSMNWSLTRAKNWTSNLRCYRKREACSLSKVEVPRRWWKLNSQILEIIQNWALRTNLHSKVNQALSQLLSSLRGNTALSIHLLQTTTSRSVKWVYRTLKNSNGCMTSWTDLQQRWSSGRWRTIMTTWPRSTRRSNGVSPTKLLLSFRTGYKL